MNKLRNLFIGISIATNAAQHSKRKLEALAFAIIVKSYHINSKYYLKPYTPAEIAKICQISDKKAKQILIDVVNFGFAKWAKNGTTLIFEKVRDKKGLCFKFDPSKFINKTINSQFIKKNDTDKESISLDMIVNEIRKILILNNIQQENFIQDTRKGFADEQNLSKAKKMRKTVEKYDIDINSNADIGISLESFMNLLKIKNRNKIVSILNDMIGEDLIDKKKNITFIKKTNNIISFKSNEFGAFFTYHNKLYQVCRNIYTIKDFNKFKVIC